ncbi:MAG: hypothetical protein J6K12_01255 [Clostridia bacterium]|nr:hypothetical protein [Clostridia bacterium]
MKSFVDFLKFVVFFSLFIFIVDSVVDYLELSFRGPKVDNDILELINTDVISENYDRFEYVESNIMDDNTCVRVSFDSLHQSNKLPAEDMSIDVYIFDDSIYTSKGKIHKRVYDVKKSKYLNRVIIEKNNVYISVNEYTNLARSEEIYNNLEYVMLQFSDATKTD